MCTRRLSGLCLCEILEARRGMASQTTSLLILLIIASDVSSYSPAFLPNLSLTATEDSCVEIKCTVTGTLADEDALWFWMKDGKWNETEKEYTGTIVYSNKITEQPISPSFEGRVNYTGSQRLTHRAGSENNPLCSILICDLKIKDNGTYFFRYIPKDQKQKWKTVNDVVLTVRENLCPITFNEPKPVMASYNITLQCSTVGSCSSDLYIESVPLSGFETNSTSEMRNATLSFRTSWEDDGREFICQTKQNKDIHLAKKTKVTVQYAPRDTVAVISSEHVTEGASLTLTCSAKGQPTPTLTWYKKQTNNPSSFYTGAEWNINSVQIEDTGEYFCTAKNKHGLEKSNPVLVDVKYAPSVKVKVFSPSSSFTQGRRVTLICEVIRSNPPPDVYTWFKNGNRLSSGQTYNKTLQPEDSGSYTCSATNTVAVGRSNPLQINVLYAPSVKVKVISPSSSFTQGRTVTLTCEVIRSNPPPDVYTWFKNGNSLSSGQTYVKNLQPEDSGSYTCSATNTVAVGRSNPLQINVLYKPRNTNINQIREVAVGRSVLFTCNTDANPPARTYSWHRVSLQPSSYPSTWTTAENSLQLKSVQKADEACYSCRATNTVGAGDNSTPLCIKVNYPPSQVTLTMDTEVIEGQRITITCSVDSSPKSHLILSRTSGTNLLEKLQEVTDKNTLSYTFSVTSAHAGVYTCHAQNHLGSNSTQRQLQVKYRPKHVRVQADPGLAVKENITLRLSCSAQSNPPVTSVTWTINGRNLTEHKGSTFTVKSVTPNDSGLYSCTAYNGFGKGQSQPVEVKVKFAPKHIKVLRAVEAQTSDGTWSVTLSCSSHSYPPVSQFTWYRKTDDRDDEVSKNMNYTVLSSQPGVYYCTARNEISEKTSEPVRLFLDGGYVKFIFLALVLLLIVLVAVFVFRLKRKKSIEEGSATSSWSFSWFKGGWTDVRGRTEPGQTKPCRNNPGPQQPPEITNGTSSINPVYSTVHLPKDNLGQRATREQHGQDHSLNYASLHFKKKTSMPPKPPADVVYSTVKTPKEEMSDIYENVKTVQRCPNLMLSYSDSSEDEVDVSYTQVNFRNKARSREAPGLSAEEEAQYSELKF